MELHRGDHVFVPGSEWPASEWDRPGQYYEGIIRSFGKAYVGVKFLGEDEIVKFDPAQLITYQREYNASVFADIAITADNFDMLTECSVAEGLRLQEVRARFEARLDDGVKQNMLRAFDVVAEKWDRLDVGPVDDLFVRAFSAVVDFKALDTHNPTIDALVKSL